MTVSPLDEKLNFDEHIQSKISKWNKFIGIVKRLSRAFPSDAFITIHKSFIRPHLDYADIIYDKPNNDSISQKIENAQYRAYLAITGTIQENSRKRFYQKLGLGSFSNRRWYR